MQLLSLSDTMTTPLDGITSTPHGPLKLAAVPVPSANAWLPLPASVVTTPRGVTSRMRKLPYSATTITPVEGITATPDGHLKVAAVPVPSAKPPIQFPDWSTPLLELPASVVTTPRGVTSRTRQLDWSATTITPLEGITATPKGQKKLAAVPDPSANAPLPLPAIVVTTPMGVTSRMRWLPESATTITPLEGIMATPPADRKLAAVPVPSANALSPLPASVVTMLLFAAGTTAAPATTSASVAADVTPSASPAVPHSRTAAYVAGAIQLTHELALHATLPPLGSNAGALVPGTVR